MALTNGSGYSVSGDTCYKTASNGTTSWAYDSTGIVLSSATVNWKYNGTDITLSTSPTAVSGTFYPKISNYYTGSSDKAMQLSTTSDSVTWKFVGSGWNSAADIIAISGMDDTTSGSGFYDMYFLSSVDGSSKLNDIKQDGTALGSSLALGPIQENDTITMSWGSAPAPSSGTRLPPPPIVLGGY